MQRTHASHELTLNTATLAFHPTRHHRRPARITSDPRRTPRAQAVEPAMKVDQESESKGIMGQYGPVIAVAGSALLLVPLLPLLFGANPDQA
jgi:hypothetical protein